MIKWLKRGICLLLLAGLCLGQGLTETEAEPIVTCERDTLENQALISGSAEAGTRTFFSVYTYDNVKKTTLLYQENGVVGESGLYQLTIPLPVLGRQYVLVRVGKEANTYAYNRYRKQLAQELQGYYLNVYQQLREGGR